MWVGREDWGPFGDTNMLLGNLPPIQGSSLVLHGGAGLLKHSFWAVFRTSYQFWTVFPLSPRVIGDWRVYFDVFKASSKRWYHIRRFQFMRHVRFTMWTNNSAKIWIKIFSDKGNIQGVQILFIQIWVASCPYIASTQSISKSGCQVPFSLLQSFRVSEKPLCTIFSVFSPELTPKLVGDGFP